MGAVRGERRFLGSAAVPGAWQHAVPAGASQSSGGCQMGLSSLPLPSPTSHPCHLQCVDNIRCNGLMMNAFEENSKVTVPQMIK